jgi:Uma2 family endonuclease
MSAAVSPYRVVLDPKAYEGIHLVESDGEPMDTILHRDCMLLLIAVVTHYNRARSDFLVGGNNFIYFNPEQARNRDYRGPDFFYVKDGVDRTRERQYWAVWEENGRLPDVVVELLSPTTEEEDRTTKFAIYEQTLRTPEYFMYDPFTHVLEGYRLVGGSYQALRPSERGWLWSEEMQFWLGTWEGQFLLTPGTYLRPYTREGELVLTAEEDEHRRAEEERQRADAAECELARLRALLGQQTKPAGEGNGSASQIK